MSPSSPSRVALVTGGSRGIGAAIARELAGAGWAVLVAARGEAACAETAAELVRAGGTAWPLALDVASPDSIRAAVARAADLARPVGPIEALVNNAGVAESAALAAPEQDELAERTLAVNYHGARRMIEALLPDMLARGRGAIVNVASSAALRGYAYVSAYCASKFALLGYTLAAADELRRRGIRVSAVCPHYVRSSMLERSIDRVVEKTGRPREDVRAFFAAENPGGRLVTPEEVAAAVLHAVGEAPTGSVLELDGSPGFTLRSDPAPSP